MRWIAALFSLGAATVLGLAVWLAPDPAGLGTHRQLGLPPCGHLMLTGKPCVSCGMTTAFSHMAEGSVGSALEANVMGVVLFLLTVLAVPWFAHAAWTAQDPFRFLYHPRGRWLLPAVATGLVLLFVQRHLLA